MLIKKNIIIWFKSSNIWTEGGLLHMHVSKCCHYFSRNVNGVGNIREEKEVKKVMIPWLFDCRKYKRPNMAECDMDLALHQWGSYFCWGTLSWADKIKNYNIFGI